MAREANYVLKLTLTEASTTRDAIENYQADLQAIAERMIARREPVSPQVTAQLDACARLLARI